MISLSSIFQNIKIGVYTLVLKFKSLFQSKQQKQKQQQHKKLFDNPNGSPGVLVKFVGISTVFGIIIALGGILGFIFSWWLKDKKLGKMIFFSSIGLSVISSLLFLTF